MPRTAIKKTTTRAIVNILRDALPIELQEKVADALAGYAGFKDDQYHDNTLGYGERKIAMIRADIADAIAVGLEED